MARLTLSELTTEISPWSRDKASTEIEPLANMILRELDQYNLGFNVLRTTFTTTPKATITVNVTQDNATVTYASAAATHDGQAVQIDGDDTWYSIDSVSVGVSFELTSVFAGATNATASAIVVYPRVQLPSNLVHIDNITYTNRKPLTQYTGSVPTGGRWSFNPSEPDAYYEVEPVNTSDDMEIMLIDPPDDRYSFELDGRKRIARYSGDASKAGLPEKHEQVLLAGVIWLVLNQTKGIEESAPWKSWYRELRKNAAASVGQTMPRTTQALSRTPHLPKSTYPDMATEV